MGLVIIQCPRTGRKVSTGMEISRVRFEAMPGTRQTMHCWVCGSDHEWSKRWAEFVEDEATVQGGVVA